MCIRDRAKTAQNNADGNGEGDFYYTPPTGYFALCTNNLSSELTLPIGKGGSYFNPVLFTGNGSNDHAITGVGFRPDWVWLKGRNSADGNNLWDINRGVNKRLFTHNSNAELADTNSLKSFDSDGFTMDNDSGVNGSGDTYVTWNWLGSNTTASNTDGSITSTVSPNTTAGFSIVTYTGTGSNATVGHGLGKVPAMMIIKNRSATANWVVYHKEMGNNTAIVLNNSDASFSAGDFQNTTPTSSVFSIGTSTSANGSGDNLVAYMFAEIEGYSKMGKYTGNGNTNGPFVYTGFRPAWILRKSSSNAETWSILDSTRSAINAAQDVLRPNVDTAEGSATWSTIDILSNGFKMRASDPATNGNGYTYIYMAFAENPFVDSAGVPANAR